jgi:hypothetical protein
VALAAVACSGGGLNDPNATGSAGHPAVLGSGGSGGGAGLVGGGGGIGGGTEDYSWGAIQVHVAPTGTVASDLTLEISDPAMSLNATLQYSPTTYFDPTDGAGVTALTICGLELRIFSCAGQYRENATAAGTGCLAAVLDERGATGEFIHPTGVRCSVNSASGIINLPPALNTPPDQAATGMFVLECAVSDGTTLKLQGTFALPVLSWFRGLC